MIMSFSTTIGNEMYNKNVQITDITNFLGITTAKVNTPPAPLETPVEKKILYSWKSFVNTQKIINKKKIKTGLVIGVVITLLLAAMQEFWLIIVIASMAFVSYLLATKPGQDVLHEISNQGLNFASQFYSWADLRYFFFSSRNGEDVLCVDTVGTLPGRLYFVLNAGDKEKVREILVKYLNCLEEEPKTVVDKLFEAISGRFKFD